MPRALWLALLLLAGCEDQTGDDDGGVPLDSGNDVGPKDSGIDTGVTPTDTGVDTGVTPADTGFSDADPIDADPIDADPIDADPVDMGPTDSGTGNFGCGRPPAPYTAGELTCAGCPQSNPPPASFVLTPGMVTSYDFTGTVTSTQAGTWFAVGANGGELFGTIPVDASGFYSITVPLFCGAQHVILVFCNAAGAYAITYDVTTTGCTEPDIRATIVWDDIGDDWELHLIRPNGTINDNASDCTWTSCIPTGPDWGVIGDATDNPMKDVDDVDTYGPENIILSSPENGVFTVMVEHWGPGSPDSDGYIILNVGGQTHVLDLIDFPPQFVRTAATIEYPGAIVRTSTALHDCTLNWSGGCRDPIP
jgi:hypothetical protein